MHHVLFSLNSCSCIVASHLGTIGEPCEGRAVGAEPEDDVWWTYPEDGRMDPDVPDRRPMLAKRVSSN